MGTVAWYDRSPDCRGTRLGFLLRRRHGHGKVEGPVLSFADQGGLIIGIGIGIGIRGTLASTATATSVVLPQELPREGVAAE